MINKSRFYFAAILLSCLWARVAFTAPLQHTQEPKIKLAVLKITFIELSLEEQDRLRAALYENLMKDERTTLMTEAQTRNELVSVGTDPAELNDEVGYVRAAQILRADYVLVGKIEKIGEFVVTTFRVFPAPKGTQGQYEAGKIMDMLVQEEIPKISELIRRDIKSALAQQPPDTTGKEPAPLHPIVEPKKGSKLRWLMLGGAAAGGITAVVLMSAGGGEGEPPAPRGLPRPPVVP